MGTQLPPKGAQPPIFGPCLLWPNGWMDQDVTWYRARPRPWPHCVRWGPTPQRGTAPQFSAHDCCGQTAGWIKMSLVREVDLGPGNIVLDGDPSPPLKGALPPIFGTCPLSPNGWMDQVATWYGGRPWPRPHCVRWGFSPPLKRAQPPLFG